MVWAGRKRTSTHWSLRSLQLARPAGLLNSGPPKIPKLSRRAGWHSCDGPGRRRKKRVLPLVAFRTGKPGEELKLKLTVNFEGTLMSGEVAPFTSFWWSSPKVVEQSTHTYMLPVLTCPDTGKGKAELLMHKELELRHHGSHRSSSPGPVLLSYVTSQWAKADWWEEMELAGVHTYTYSPAHILAHP